MTHAAHAAVNITFPVCFYVINSLELQSRCNKFSVHSCTIKFQRFNHFSQHFTTPTVHFPPFAKIEIMVGIKFSTHGTPSFQQFPAETFWKTHSLRAKDVQASPAKFKSPKNLNVIFDLKDGGTCVQRSRNVFGRRWAARAGISVT